MKQTQILWALTSTLLILAVVLLRTIFGRRMGAGLKYALWGLVLVRLLVPVQLFTLPVPELGRTQTVEAPRPSAVLVPVQTAGVPAVTGPLPDDTVVNVTTIPESTAPHVVALDVQKILGGLWLAGSAVTAAVFLSSNLKFARRLRRVRRPLPEERGDDVRLSGDLPVYVAENLPSPCLFGLFRPVVYITPAAAAEPDILRHVLAHEYTHFRHGDHIWNVLRGAALVLHWWNPLVWLAAALSRRDCELACDEGALRRLGEEERFAYGRTLLSLIGARSRPADLLSCATTMTGDGKTVAQRVKRIAQAPKRWLWAAVAAVLLAGIVTVCAFGQAEPTQPPEQDPVSGDPRLPWTENADSLRYVRDKGGVPDEFAIRLHRDGTFTYYEGGLSSFIGAGTWTREGDVIRLADERNQANLMYHYFTLEEDALVFRAEESSDFMYTDVAGGDRFSLDTDPPERDWFDDAINRPPTEPTGTATPAPEEPVAYSIMEDANRMEITGLDCESASWFAGPASSGLVVAGRRDLMKAETLGHLSISQPRFLGEAFSAKGGELLSIYYPEEGPLLFFGFDEHDNGRLKPETATVYAFVDLSDGTVREKKLTGFGDRAGEFTDEFLVDTARTLAGLIQDGARFYDESIYNIPIVRALDEEAEQGENPDLLLAYRGKETRFSGLWKHIPGEATTGTVVDLDGDGKDELVVILYAGGGTGAAIDDLYVFDADTLEQLGTIAATGPEPPPPVLDGISSAGDTENFYLTGPGLDVAISKEEVRENYKDIPMDDTLQIGAIVEFSLENGVVHCNLPCSSYYLNNYIGAVDATLSFSRTEGFRCVKAEYTPYEDNTSDLYEKAKDKMDQEKDEDAKMQKELEAAQAELEERRKAAEIQAGGQGQVTDSEQLDAFLKTLEEEREKSVGGIVGYDQDRSNEFDKSKDKMDVMQYYAADSLPLFEIAFSQLDQARQSGWLNRLYSDGDHAFFSAAVRGADPSLLPGLAEQAYTDGKISFFSTLADHMSEGELRTWLDRALADGKWNFQSMLFDRLDMDKEKDAKEEEWARQQAAEYQAVGVTMDGKNYYYQGQLVNIFLDIRANGSFYTLDTNPAGAVNVKILRNGNDKITGAAYMTEAEAAELLNDMAE